MVYAENFEEQEFGSWGPYMSPRLVTMLDVLRFRLDQPIHISPHPKALGRRLGKTNESEHNIDFWGEVLAVDCFVKRVFTRSQASNVIHTARMIGFTGIGIYPEWTNSSGVQQVGFHLGVRPTARMGEPAEWGFLNGRQTTLEQALTLVPFR